MQIAIIGAGSVGESLGRGWAAGGHDVVFGVRDTGAEKVQRLLSRVEGTARATSVPEAAEAGEVVVLAVPGAAVVDVADRLGTALAGKTVVDPTNQLHPPEDGRSLAERVAHVVSDAHVVKAFNTVGAERLRDPVVDGERATMFLCGDSAAAKQTVSGLAEDLGFEVVDTGVLGDAGMLEDLARLWIHLSRKHGRSIAFRLLGA